ncbi:MAG: DEAD/DEAH box helicase [Muribaculaceae bacterium]|nr:DEAD/DEAH box helicase [Muribaculaceae bacterium]
MDSKQLTAFACERLGIKSLNAMQQASIESCQEHNDVILLAPTGSGKTLAYLIPLFTRIKPQAARTQALIIVPTRELAQQVEQVARTIASGYRIVCCYGGHSFRDEARSLETTADVVLGTPGRLLDHVQRGRLSLEHIDTLILDEFDKSLELGFHNEMRSLIRPMKGLQMRILTSATDLSEIPDFVAMPRAKRLYYIDNTRKTEQKQQLAVYHVASPEKDKLDTLYELLCRIDDSSTIIFCNQRESVERVADFLKKKKVVCAAFHGGMEQPDRERALCRFRNRSVNICVATDLAARGLDVAAVGHVIHYHLPLDAEAYTHRNGRTARMDAEGNAYLIVAPHEELPLYIEDIRYLRLDSEPHAPATPVMETLHFAAGKREKLSKGDILGFLTRMCELQAAEVGLIEVKDHYSYAAIARNRLHDVLQKAQTEKIKGRRIKVNRAF